MDMNLWGNPIQPSLIPKAGDFWPRKVKAQAHLNTPINVDGSLQQQLLPGPGEPQHLHVCPPCTWNLSHHSLRWFVLGSGVIFIAFHPKPFHHWSQQNSNKKAPPYTRTAKWLENPGAQSSSSTGRAFPNGNISLAAALCDLKSRSLLKSWLHSDKYSSPHKQRDCPPGVAGLFSVALRGSYEWIGLLSRLSAVSRGSCLPPGAEMSRFCWQHLYTENANFTAHWAVEASRRWCL